MSVTIKFRRGTATQWTTNGSTVLASGEPGYEVDTGRLKIGNGLTAWSGLSYSSIIPSGLLAGSGININLGTNGATATISVSGLNSTYISDFNEAVDDRIGSGLFVAGTGINLLYNDSGNNFTVSVSGLIANPTNNRILTSRDSTTTGIDAESNLTFDGSKLGINTVSPSGALDVAGDAYIRNSTNTVGNLYFKSSTANSETSCKIRTDTFGNLYLDAGPYVKVGNQDGTAQVIAGNAPVTIGHNASSSTNQNIIFTPRSIERVRIASDGKVGIGISSPSGELHVVGTGIFTSVSGSLLHIDNIRIDGNTISVTNTDGNLILSSNGNGAIQRRSTGDARGAHAVDLQSSTATNAEVAAGSYAVIAGGASNQISSDSLYCSVNGGFFNSVSGSFFAPICGGYTNLITGANFSSILGGTNNIVSGDYSAILGGQYNKDNNYNNVFILGSNITASQADTTYVQNLIASAAGSFNSLSVNGTGVSISGHTHTASQITDFNEAVDDRIGSIGSGLFVAGTGINLSYDDIGNSFTVSVTGLINNPTNNRILTSRDNTTTGIDAENNLTFNGSLLGVSGDLIANTGTLSILQFNTNNGAVFSQGQMGWNTTQGTVDLALTNTATIEVGEHQMYRVRNTTSNTLYRGQPVYASGVHANGIITPNLYVSDGSIDEIRFIGLVYEDINNNNNGYVVAFGHMYNIDTRGNVASNIAVGDETWADGDILYPHPTVAGKLTKVPPKHNIPIALVLDAANNGKLYVRRDLWAGELDDLHDIDVSGVTNGQFLQYNSATDYWIPSSSGNFTTLLVNGTGVSISGHTHTASQITDFNEAVDDRVGSGLFVAGTGINLTYNDAGNSFTVSVTGLVNNPTNNRILTSRDSTTTGIDAESYLTFNGDNFTVGNNSNNGSSSTIAGGGSNTIASGAAYNFIGGGSTNTINSWGYNAIVGGIANTINSGLLIFNFIGCGNSNTIRAGDRSFIGGGSFIAISGNDNTIVGGGGHLASGIFNFIGGGSTNRIINSAEYSVIPGGRSNLIQTSGSYSSIVGGSGNTINTNFSTIVGGVSNTANHNNVFILGSNITSTQADTTYVQNLIASATGNFNTLQVNGTGVSISGHTHTSSDIINFNSTVSGLLPTISNSGDNRVLTSTGSSTGITAESTFLYDGVNYNLTAGGSSNSIAAGSTNTSILGGSINNIAGGGGYNTIAGGVANYIIGSGTNCFIGNGAINAITSSYSSSIVGGNSNTVVSGINYVSIGGGVGGVASGVYSIIPGGYYAKTTRYGELSHAAGRFASAGDAQHTTLIARKTTTDATANQALFLDNSSARLTIPAKTTWTFSIKLSAYNDTDSAAAGWIYRGVIKRDGSNNTSLVGSVIEENWKDSAMSSASSSVVADDSNEALEIRVTGLASKNIRWVAVVDISQVSYGTP